MKRSPPFEQVPQYETTFLRSLANAHYPLKLLGKVIIKLGLIESGKKRIITESLVINNECFKSRLWLVIIFNQLILILDEA